MLKLPRGSRSSDGTVRLHHVDLSRMNGVMSAPISIGFMLLLLVGLPLMAARNSRLEDQIEVIEASRLALYLSAAITLLILAGLTAGLASWQGLSGAQLGWAIDEPATGLAWAVAATAAGLAITWLSGVVGRRVGLSESPLLRALVPRTPPERRAFLLLAGIGSVCEEYLYRGFIMHVLAAWTGEPWIAAALAALSFGFAHGYQRASGVLRAALLGMLLAVPVIWTGSLFPAVLAHFWINAAVSLWGWRWLLPEQPATAQGGDA